MGRRAKKRHERRLESWALVVIERGWQTLHVRPGCARAAAAEDAIRSAAAAQECDLAVSVAFCGDTATLHFQFNSWATGRRRLDWWPGNGAYRTAAGARGQAYDWKEVIQLLGVPS